MQVFYEVDAILSMKSATKLSFDISSDIGLSSDLSDDDEGASFSLLPASFQIGNGDQGDDNETSFEDDNT